MTNFVQYSPYNGKQPSQKTEVKIGYDDRAIYIGAVCYDRSPEKIAKGISIRDQFPPGMSVDIFAILISPYNDGLNSVFLYVTAAGVQRDVKIYGDQHEFAWDAVWESKVKITSFGWVVEMKIPLSALRFSTKPVQNWGLNLWRWIARNREWDVWNFVDITYPGWWKKNGLWKGIENLNPPLRLSFTPYVSGYVEFDSGSGTEFLYNGGIDFKYGITQSFTLDSTLVPDFGQVQSDDIELNLSPYEIKYNEKRQFFTEGTELFSKGDLFYSRRIGDKPVDYDAIYDEIGEDEVIYKNPNETRLINATKLSGRTNFGLGIGVVNAMTANTYATVLNQVTGEERKVLTQPFTNYNMVVLDQTLFSHSYISLVNSNVTRRGHHANVTAVDFKFADNTNTYGLNGIYGYSWIRSNDEGQTGYKLLLNGGKIGGNFQAKYNLSLISDDYDQNDFGYLRRNNEVVNQLRLSHQTSKPFACFMDLQNQLRLIYSRAYEPSAFSEFIYNYEVLAEFKNYFVLSLRFEHAPIERRDYYEPRVVGRYFINYKYYKYGISGQTDPRKPIWIEMSGDYFESYDYDFDVSSMLVSMSPYINLNDHLNLGLKIAYEKNTNQLGYVDQDFDNGIIYFGKRNRETVVSTFESSYVFNNKISLTIRLRHYHSKADYASFFELKQDGKFELSDYNENHDINYNAFNIDLTLRWNFAPGSEILLNWKNAIYTSDQSLGDNYWQNFVTTLGQPQVNSISLKVIYYFEI
ncbi:MAG: carbohydrate binding family 9 domain-containing protein [Candidatus Aminicenantes bacterium]|nr:carbohydrate binding family 9 domain-containing protein [Candidatus Aminicenantes bacterium]